MAVPPSPHRSSSSNQPSPNYHYQRSPSSSGPPVFPSGMPVNRSHVSSAGQKSPTKGASRPTSVVGKGTPSRRMDVSGGGHGATRSMDSTSRLVGTSSTSPTPVNMDEIERDFQNMMNVLEVPASVRDKMNTMEPHVKRQFLRNSQSFNLASTPSRPAVPPQMRNSATSPNLHGQPISAPLSAALNAAPDYSTPSTPLSRGPNADYASGRPMSVSNQANVFQAPAGGAASDKKSKKKDKAATIGASSSSKGQDGPVMMARWLKEGPKAAQMDIVKVKKLRMLLRQETTVWIEVFLQERGYLSLLRRLSEVLEMEWREEQHDDQLLHELLRCVKALATSDVGCVAIRSCTPNPFFPLVALLFTDKKPGDVPTRQLMTEILTLLFDLYPSRPPAPRWPGDQPSGRDYIFPLPREYESLPKMVRELLLGEDKDKDVVEFVTAARRPRVFKTYLTEISDVCRDYFWMFCHGNGIWELSEVDTNLIERPTAPGGATGGVEYEAGNYLTAHFKLINAMARSCLDHNEPLESELSAWRFHAQLHESGLDRIILASRKASTTYYPNLHLELSRYCALAMASEFQLPQQILRLIEPPPSQYRKINGQTRDRMTSQGLDGGRHLGKVPHGSPRLKAGRTSPASSGTPTKIDERFVFQGQRPPVGRKFSPAPQITTDVLARGGEKTSKKVAVLDVDWN